MKYLIILYSILLIIIPFFTNHQVSVAENRDLLTSNFPDSCHFLRNESLQNFSCYISTATYQDFQDQIGDTVSGYPLKIIWMEGNKLYYVLQPYDDSGSEQRKDDILEQIRVVRTKFQVFYHFWQQLGINNPARDIPDSVEISYYQDSISVYYLHDDNRNRKNIRKIFSKSGLLKKMEINAGERILSVFPYYIQMDDKYVCNGWRIFISRDGYLSEESFTRLELETVGVYYLPVRAVINLRKQESSSERVGEVILIKGYEFNNPLQEIESP